MRWMLLTLCVAAPAAADEARAVAAAPAPTTLPAPASATASGGWVIRITAPTAATTSQPQAPTTTAPAPSAQAVVTDPSCEDIKVFKDKMHAAVDAALKYPAELRFRPAAGVTFVAYEYQDGRTDNVHITQWSGDGRLDRAAVAAVKNANFAAITPGIGHRRIHDVVIIIYDNSKDEEGKNAKEQSNKKQFSQDCR